MFTSSSTAATVNTTAWISGTLLVDHGLHGEAVFAYPGVGRSRRRRSRSALHQQQHRRYREYHGLDQRHVLVDHGLHGEASDSGIREDRLAVEAVVNKDVPLIQAVVFTVAAVLLLVNILIDFAYTALP